MEVGNVLRCIRQSCGEVVLSGLKFGQSFGKGTVLAALLNDAHDFPDGLHSLGKLATHGLCRASSLMVEPVGFLRIGAHGLGGDGRCHHPLAQAGQHTGFQNLAVDGSSIAAAMRQHMVGACVRSSATGIGTSAAAAEQQAGQQGAWAVSGIQRAISGEAALHALARSFDLVLVTGG